MHELAHYKDEAYRLDRTDVLADKRHLFQIDEKVIYCDGNSLGRMPIATKALMTELLERQWGNRLIRSWNENWIDLPLKVAEKIATLLKVEKEEIVVCDNTSINLYKLFFAALALQKERKTILTDIHNFPTDHYVLQGLIDKSFPKHSVTQMPNGAYDACDNDIIKQHLGQDTALLTLSHVLYKSGYLYPMAEINKMAAEVGAMNVWDLSHSVGAVPINLRSSKTQLAVGCTYKYLNGGPGAPAFMFVDREVLAQLSNPISAWFGHESPFDFAPHFEEAKGITKFYTGTPSILSLAPVEKGLDVFLHTDESALRAKSQGLTNFFIRMVQSELANYGFKIVTPLDESKRGSHITLYHPESYRINQALINPQSEEDLIIIPDYRPVGFIRFGFAALYNSYSEVYTIVTVLKDIIETKRYEAFSSEVQGVP